MVIHDKNLEEIYWLFHSIFDHYFKNEDQIEFLLNWGPKYDATCEPRSNVTEKAISGYLACMRSAMSDRLQWSSEVRLQDATSKQREQISAH